MKRNDMAPLLTFVTLLAVAPALVSCARPSEGDMAGGQTAPRQNLDQLDLDEKAAPQIKVEAAQLKPDARTVFITGKIQYNEDRLSKISSPVVGRSTEIKVKLGEKVSAGEPLMAVESPDIGSAYADFYKSRSDLAFAERGRVLAKDLYETKAISQKELQQAKNDYLKAQTEFNRAKSRLIALHIPDKNLENLSEEPPLVQSLFFLKSPLSGTVIEKNVALGQTVGADPAQNLFSIADLSTVYFVGEIFEKDISEIRLDQEIAMSVDAYPGETFRGKISYIGDLIDPNTRTLRIRGEVKNPSGKLKPEMFARIMIRIGASKEILSIPQEAVFKDGEETIVFVALSDRVFRRSRVVLGPRFGSEVQVTQGLQNGDRVVTEGGLLLKSMMESRLL